MAESIPAALKIPEISRFLNRANQLRSTNPPTAPAISYWCDCHAVNQIIGKGLHNADEEVFAYTKMLLERLEVTKNEYANEEAITDSATGQAYVELFAQQTFDRAERTLRANKVTRTTADTFDAAATFFDLLNEFGPLEPEVAQKIKFAKWNAARILKAIREGRDPNESNPKQETAQPEEAQLDPNDPDVQQINAPQSASVQDIPDAGEPLHSGAVSPLSSDTPQPGIPENQYVPPPAPVDDPYTTSTQIPLQPSPQIPTKLPQEYTPGPPSPPIEAPPSWPTEDPIVPTAPPNIAGPPPPVIPQGPSVPTYAPAPPTVPATAPVPSPAPIPLPVQGGPPPAPLQSRNYKDINQAQKHAKWAISALNFEDIPTAVQELRNALAMLGAQ